MALTPEEAAALATLVYADGSSGVLSSVEVGDGTMASMFEDIWKSAGNNGNETLGGLLRVVTPAQLEQLRGVDGIDGLRMSGDDWADIIEMAQSDPALSSLEIHDRDPNVEADGTRSIIFADGQNAYIAYRGTGHNEWDTDVEGLCNPDTEPEQEALRYYDKIDAEFSGNVVAIGHSNGANKAMYVAILRGAMAYAFDGQGFPPEFFEKYGQLVDEHAHLINYYAVGDDFVSALLLTPVAPSRIHWVLGQRYEGKDFGAVHSPVSFLNQSMLLEPGGQSRLNWEIRRLSAWLCELDPKTRQEVSAYLAPILDAVLGHGDYLNALLGAIDPGGLAFTSFALIGYPSWVSFFQAAWEAAGDPAFTREFAGASSLGEGLVHDFSDETVNEVEAAGAMLMKEFSMGSYKWACEYEGEGWYDRLSILDEQAAIMRALSELIDTAGDNLHRFDGVNDAMRTLDRETSVKIDAIGDRLGELAAETATLFPA